jgi:hypothetical protein
MNREIGKTKTEMGRVCVCVCVCQDIRILGVKNWRSVALNRE